MTYTNLNTITKSNIVFSQIINLFFDDLLYEFTVPSERTRGEGRFIRSIGT